MTKKQDKSVDVVPVDVDGDGDGGVATEEKICFVMMPFTSPEGYPNEHFKIVYEDLICPACKIAEVVPRKVNDILKTSFIQTELVEMLVESPIAICDLSTRNPNVFFELGLRIAFDKPTVLIKDENVGDIFDLSTLRCVEYDSLMRNRYLKRDIINLSTFISETLCDDSGAGFVSKWSINAAEITKANANIGEFMHIISSRLSNIENKIVNSYKNNSVSEIDVVSKEEKHLSDNNRLRYLEILYNRFVRNVKNGDRKFIASELDRYRRMGRISDSEYRNIKKRLLGVCETEFNNRD